MSDPDVDSCQQKALSLLARRTHFRAELFTKLSQRGFGAGTVETVLDRLAARGWLDDGEAARRFVEERMRRGPLGRRRLLAELAQRGADETVARRAIDELLPADETESVRLAAGRWRATNPAGRRDALARHLERKGFPSAAILTVLEETEDDPSTDC